MKNISMISINWLVTALAALIPLIVGSIWYNPKVLGNVWIKSTGLTEEQLRQSNMAKIFGLTLVFSFMLALALNPIVIHQFHVGSLFFYEMEDLNTPGTAAHTDYTVFMSKYGQNFRTFKHGVFHGTIAAVLIALPIIGINALFERKSAKYIFIHLGYWVICIALMGGVICQFT